jgi:putative ABC transport system permease protein
MLFGFVIRQAWRVLKRNRMRSALTVLGITIGIAAVICVVAIGQAGSRQYEEQLHNLGDNLVWVEAGGRNVNGVRTGTQGTSTLMASDAEAILRQVPLIKAVSPQVDGGFTVVYGNQNWTTRYAGEGPDFLEIRRWTLASGANISEDDVARAANVCVLGNTVRQQLFGERDPVGEVIKVKDIPCKVIGTLAPKGANVYGRDQDDFVLLPYTMAQKKIAGIDYLKDIMCSATTTAAVPEATAQVMGLLRDRHRIRPGQDDDFNIRSPQEMVQAAIEASRTFTLLLVAIAGVSLVVGGIGIMNVMLVSVTERTREIGVRMAVGATEKQVRFQFLGEAVVLSLLGGCCGVLVGTVGSFIIGHLLDWEMMLSLTAIVLAALFSVFVGVLFGYYPAHKASQLDPIEALRFE